MNPVQLSIAQWIPIVRGEFLGVPGDASHKIAGPALVEPRYVDM